MDAGSAIVLISVGFVLLVGFSTFALISLREGERRAARVTALIGVLSGVVLVGAGALPYVLRLGVVAAAVLAGSVMLLSLLLPVGTHMVPNGRPSRRVDERGIVFARARLEPGSAQYDSYYSMNPENRAGDDLTRSLPGLLSPHAREAEPEAFASARASFLVTEALEGAVDGPVAASRTDRSPAEASRSVKHLAEYYGALDVGITAVRDYHFYSHVGRGLGTYGEEIAVDDRWAIAFTVEMDHGAMRAAPEAPVVAESARQYVEAAKIGIQLAATIRGMGYSARAHIDGNYQVIAPLVAVDAGLGEIGRMGILMTPRLGPRVRLGVVTTEMPLVEDSPGDDPTVLDFCATCRKCAENCPSNSIPFGDREPIDGGLRWAIDAESCFRYWNVIGTDCGRCMAVCPYAHPDSGAHNLVRWMMRHSGEARRAALWMDDLVYGRQL